jgi:uncharacterized protein YaaR (DUF327 family)
MSRPSDLTEELTLQIRQLVLEGVKYKDIQERLDVLPGTWDKWYYEDYKDFRKSLISWKQERLVKKSEKLSDEILDLGHFDEKGKAVTDILRIKQKESEYVRSTLGKDEGYSTRQELTAKGGQPLFNKLKELPDDELTNIAYGKEETSDSGISQEGTSETQPS